MRTIPEGLRTAAHTTIEILRDTYDHWRRSRTLRLGASVAYYTLFAFVPLLMLAAALLSLLGSDENVTAFLEEALAGLGSSDPVGSAAELRETLAQAQTSWGIFGSIGVLVSASFLILALQDAINVIWDVPVQVGLRHSIHRRLVALGVALLTAVFFAVGFLAQSIVGAISAWLPEGLEVFDPSRSIIVSLALWAIGVAAITLIFRVLPDAVVSWHTAVVGGTITALLVALGSSLIGLYVSNYAASSISGAIGSVLAFLLWVYLETQIVLGGAVLTKILQDRREEVPIPAG